MENDDREILGEGKYLRLVRDKGWEYAEHKRIPDQSHRLCDCGTVHRERTVQRHEIDSLC